MSTVGQKEKKIQQRVVKLFGDTLGYRYLGNWEEREGVDGNGNRNIEPDLLRAWLKPQGKADALIGKVLYELDKHLPQRRVDRRQQLRSTPLAHETWTY